MRVAQPARRHIRRHYAVHVRTYQRSKTLFEFSNSEKILKIMKKPVPICFRVLLCKYSNRIVKCADYAYFFYTSFLIFLQAAWLPVVVRSWTSVRLEYSVAHYTYASPGFDYAAAYNFNEDVMCGQRTYTTHSGNNHLSVFPPYIHL